MIEIKPGQIWRRNNIGNVKFSGTEYTVEIIRFNKWTGVYDLRIVDPGTQLRWKVNKKMYMGKGRLRMKFNLIPTSTPKE